MSNTNDPRDVFTAKPIEEPDDPENIDDEDTSGAPEAVPWDPLSIRITTKAFSLREIVEQIKDKDIDISPDFQRDFVWKIRQQSRLIESILLGIPLPAFYFDQTPEGTYNVVDGVQRLSTIARFMNNAHRLNSADLEYLKRFDGLSFSELEPTEARRFRATQIVVHVIEPQTPDDVKYDIFNRVNTLGSPLSAQEIRHAMSKPRSREFLKKLAESKEFDEATENKYWRRDEESFDGRIRDSGRMANREMVLRFCAFRTFSEDVYRKFPSLDSYLVDFTKRIDERSSIQNSLTDSELEELESDFYQAMVNAHVILGKAAFRRWPLNQERRGPINRALFEAQANALADYRKDDLLPHKKRIIKEFRAVFDDPDYQRSVTVSTGDPRQVEHRLSTTKSILSKMIK